MASAVTPPRHEEYAGLRKKNSETQSALEQERGEVARLKAELEKANATQASLKSAFVEATQRQKQTLDAAESRVLSAETALSSLRSRNDLWLNRLASLNSDMNSKFSILQLCCFLHLFPSELVMLTR
jgi:chromosome segregation ATPase